MFFDVAVIWFGETDCIKNHTLLPTSSRHADREGVGRHTGRQANGQTDMHTDMEVDRPAHMKSDR